MSGICGYVHANDRPIPTGTLSAMTEAAAHRGPDGIDAWTGQAVGLAHLTLNVTAHDERESQPLVSGDLAVVADARIDNRSDLRSRLDDHLRASNPTDADLILAAYRRWGEDCAAHLLGDFAFALWDGREDRLFAARDPMGMRPLCYRSGDDRFLFGSQGTQILAAPEVSSSVSTSTVAAYLQSQFEPLHRTFYEGIRYLEPAHALLRLGDGSIKTWRYWDIDPTKRIRYEDERDYAEHLRHLLAEAVGCRLRSTTPVGLFLSGGVDSGSIASMAGHLKENGRLDCPNLRTYSWAFETLSQCDERDVSTRIADRYGFPTTPVDAEAVQLIGPPHGAPDRDAPLISHYQALLARGLRQAHNQGVRRVLHGQHGDLLTGSWIFDNLTLLRTCKVKTLCSELRAQQKALGLSLPDLLKRSLYKPIRAQLWPPGRLPKIRKSVKRMWHLLRSDESNSRVPEWATDALRERAERPSRPRQAPPEIRGHARRRRYLSITVPLQRRTSAWLERLYSRHHMACADPWADRRLIEYVMAIPQHQIYRNGQNKYITRAALQGIMPENARSRLRKVIPTPLYERALKEQEERVRAYIDFPVPFVDSDQLEEYYDQRIHGGHEDFRFWLALCLKMWLFHHDGVLNSIDSTSHNSEHVP